MVRTLVAHYRDSDTAHQVIEALLEAGFLNDDLRLLVEDGRANTDQDITPGAGAGFGALVGTLVGIGSALVPGISPLIDGGALAVVVTAGIGAAAGALTGGITAGALDLGLNDETRAVAANEPRWDGTIVSLTTQEQWLEWAQRIMARHKPLEIEGGPVEWRDREWSVFSPAHDNVVRRSDETTPHASSTMASHTILKGHAHVYPYNN